MYPVRTLRDAAVFRQVKIDPEVHMLVGPNGADFDPPNNTARLAGARRGVRGEGARLGGDDTLIATAKRVVASTTAAPELWPARAEIRSVRAMRIGPNVVPFSSDYPAGIWRVQTSPSPRNSSSVLPPSWWPTVPSIKRNP